MQVLLIWVTCWHCHLSAAKTPVFQVDSGFKLGILVGTYLPSAKVRSFCAGVVSDCWFLEKGKREGVFSQHAVLVVILVSRWWSTWSRNWAELVAAVSGCFFVSVVGLCYFGRMSAGSVRQNTGERNLARRWCTLFAFPTLLCFHIAGFFVCVFLPHFPCIFGAIRSCCCFFSPVYPCLFQSCTLCLRIDCYIIFTTLFPCHIIPASLCLFCHLPRQSVMPTGFCPFYWAPFSQFLSAGITVTKDIRSCDALHIEGFLGVDPVLSYYQHHSLPFSASLLLLFTASCLQGSL